MYTNVNISNNEHSCNYIVEYKPISDKCGIDYHIDGDVYVNAVDGNEYKSGEVLLYFPSYSMDVYTHTNYTITCGIWIGDKFVNIVNETINRSDAVACDKLTKFGDDTYYEMYKFVVADPYSILYDDDWKEFREDVCGEAHMQNYSINSTGSILYITLHPTNDDEWFGGQSSMNITGDPSNYFSIHIQSNTRESLKVDERPAIECFVKYNSVYDNLDDYLLETYHITEYSILYELVIGNEDEMGGVLQSELTKSDNWVFDKDDLRGMIGDRMTARASLHIMDSDGESLIYMLSNALPLTDEIKKYLVGDDFEINGYKINHVELNNVDMNVYNINAVNQIKTNVIKTTHNQKGMNHIKPIFYRTVEASSIVIHPEVTEIICINLDRYNHLVDRFILSVGGVQIPEYGRNNNGVLFRLVQTTMKGQGTYYVLNQDSELITSGKYICE